MVDRTSRLLLTFVALVATAWGTARAEIVINVDQGATQPVPIAIPAFEGGSQASEIAKVVAEDLRGSGLFRPLDPAGLPAGANVDMQPKFDDWKGVGAQGLLVGRVGSTDGRLSADFRLWDVYAGQSLIGSEFTSTPANWRRVAHKIADAVYQKLTGQKGYFDTRVVFVAESGTKAKPVRRLEIMDQDGANPSYLTDGSALVFTPRFSANSQEITYMALRPTGSTIYLLNIDTGRQEALGSFSRYGFCSPFLRRWAQGRLLGGSGRQHRHLCDEPREPRHGQAHQRPGDRHLAIVFPRRPAAGV